MFFELKGPLPDLTQFLTTESPLKKMKMFCYVMVKAFFCSQHFFFCSLHFCPDFLLFGHVAEWLDKKGQVNFDIYDVTGWKANNYHTYINQYLKK